MIVPINIRESLRGLRIKPIKKTKHLSASINIQIVAEVEASHTIIEEWGEDNVLRFKRKQIPSGRFGMNKRFIIPGDTYDNLGPVKANDYFLELAKNDLEVHTELNNALNRFANDHNIPTSRLSVHFNYRLLDDTFKLETIVEDDGYVIT